MCNASIQTSADILYAKSYTIAYGTIRLTQLSSCLSQQMKGIVIYFLELDGGEVYEQR